MNASHAAVGIRPEGDESLPTDVEPYGSDDEPYGKKRRKHDQLVVSVKDVIVPKILQPIQTALARQVDIFKAECEQWDPPNIGDDATGNYKPPKILLRNVYARWCSIRRQGCLSTLTFAQAGPAYAVIKGLLALLHSDVDSSAYESTLKRQHAANKLYTDFCSHQD